MANFAAVKPGGWSWEDPITPDHITGIQEMLVKTANFSEGSIHSPTGLVSVGGAGIWHSHPWQIINPDGQTVFGDLSSFLMLGDPVTPGTKFVYLSNSKSSGGTIPDGSVIFATNLSTQDDVILTREGGGAGSTFCYIPKVVTSPEVSSSVAILVRQGVWTLFWGSAGVGAVVL